MLDKKQAKPKFYVFRKNLAQLMILEQKCLHFFTDGSILQLSLHFQKPKLIFDQKRF